MPHPVQQPGTLRGVAGQGRTAAPRPADGPTPAAGLPAAGTGTRVRRLAAAAAVLAAAAASLASPLDPPPTSASADTRLRLDQGRPRATRSFELHVSASNYGSRAELDVTSSRPVQVGVRETVGGREIASAEGGSQELDLGDPSADCPQQPVCRRVYEVTVTAPEGGADVALALRAHASLGGDADASSPGEALRSVLGVTAVDEPREAHR